MREILFKAKRKDNGKWVEGLIWKKKYNHSKIFISCFPDKDDNEEVYVVDETTICQYTGLTDKNGNKIWENDVLRVLLIGENEMAEENCIVRYGRRAENFKIELGFNLEWTKTDYLRCDICFWIENREVEVIGNIIDNPELLGG